MKYRIERIEDGETVEQIEISEDEALALTVGLGSLLVNLDCAATMWPGIALSEMPGLDYPDDFEDLLDRISEHFQLRSEEQP